MDNGELGVFIQDPLGEGEPNCARVVVGDEIWVVASRNIDAGDELLWSYGKTFWLVYQQIKEDEKSVKDNDKEEKEWKCFDRKTVSASRC